MILTNEFDVYGVRVCQHVKCLSEIIGSIALSEPLKWSVTISIDGLVLIPRYDRLMSLADYFKFPINFYFHK